MLNIIFRFLLIGLIQSSQSLDNCLDANPNCISVTSEEMNTRLNYLIYNRSCDHNAVFAKTYALMTEYLDHNVTTVTTNGELNYTNFFYNPQHISREARVLANYYFNARDKWTTAQYNDVPNAWQIAFQAADNRELSALGDIILGINAHINRDLPYVAASLGLTYADGISGKADLDLVNDVVAEATNQVINDIANHFDPSILELFNPITNQMFYQTILKMRNNSWNNAVKLVNSASNSIAYNIESSNIENDSSSLAKELRQMFKTNTTTRDLFCRRMHGLE